MNKYIYFVLLTTLLCCSCSDRFKTIYLKADQVDGLQKSAKVFIKGLEIGHVEEIKLNSKAELLLRLSIENEVLIPNDSKFISQKSFLGDNQIYINLGESQTVINENDTVLLTSDNLITNPDSVAVEIKGLFEKLIKPKQNDSILIELRRINKNLEELKLNK